MGVPVITCPGETFASRHSLTHLSNVGLADGFVARDKAEYVRHGRAFGPTTWIVWPKFVPRCASAWLARRCAMANALRRT